MANSLVATKQTQYETTMLTLLGESQGAQLWKICEADRSVTGEKTTFYRLGEATTKSSINGYSDTPANTTGDSEKLEVSPTAYYSDRNLGYADLKNTNLDIKSALMKSMTQVLQRAEDLSIITAIEAQVTAGNIVADSSGVSEYISSDDNVDRLIEAIAYASVLAKDNGDHGMDVMVAMSREDFAKLRRATKLTNADFKEGLQRDDKGYNLMGGYITTVQGITAGDVYVVPAKTVCFASWSDGDKAVMTDLPAKDEVHLMARKTYGSKIFDNEAPYITKFEFKDPTA